MRSRRRTRQLSAALVALALGLGLPFAAHAGCGCDHPPPDWSLVMPPFASPGKTIEVFPTVGQFLVGATYEVRFNQTPGSVAVGVTAVSTSHLDVTVPATLVPGPVELHVIGPDYDQRYARNLFTALPKARVVPAGSGTWLGRGFRAAVSEDGILYVPIDVSNVLEATQFAFGLRKLGLSFGHDDLVIYNTDGVDLTLFTLQVDDPTQYQWGSYYGWQVQQDTNLYGLVYDKKIKKPKALLKVSDVATYWRHEFYTYAAAHAPGGSHEVDANGLHPDGTRHVDHDHLVIAIAGKKRSALDPLDPTLATPLSPGYELVDLAWVSVESPDPIDPATMAVYLEDYTDDTSPELPEDN